MMPRLQAEESLAMIYNVAHGVGLIMARIKQTASYLVSLRRWANPRGRSGAEKPDEATFKAMMEGLGVRVIEHDE